MMATFILTWPLVLLACCWAIVLFILLLKLLLKRRSIIAGLGVAIVVIAFVGVVLLRVGPGRFASVWPRSFRPHMLRQLAQPPAPPELAELEWRTAQIEEHRDEIIAAQMQEAEQEYLEASEKALAHHYALALSDDGASVLVLPEDPSASSVSVEIREKKRAFRKKVRDFVRGAPFHDRALRHDGVLASVVTALAIAAFLFLGYIFLDASTRGHFTWSLRILSVLVFVTICVAMAALRHGL